MLDGMSKNASSYQQGEKDSDLLGFEINYTTPVKYNLVSLVAVFYTKYKVYIKSIVGVMTTKG